MLKVWDDLCLWLFIGIFFRIVEIEGDFDVY